jgi:hypothetical protein
VNVSLQDNLKTQRGKAEELHEDNSRMADELDRVEEERVKLQQKLHDREKELKKVLQSSPSTHASHAPSVPSPMQSSPVHVPCGHSSLFSQLQVHVQRVDHVIQQSVILSKRLQAHATAGSGNTGDRSDESIDPVEISNGIPSEVMTLVTEQTPLLSQAIGELSVIRELVDPVAVVLAAAPPVTLPSPPSPRHSRQRDPSEGHVDEAELRRERDEYKNQLDMQQVSCSFVVVCLFVFPPNYIIYAY